MSTAAIDSGGSGGGFNRILSHISTGFHRTNSVGTTEHTSGPSTTSLNVRATANPIVEPSWIRSFNFVDRFLSGSLLNLFYRFIDIALLLIGLLSNSSNCSVGSQMGITCICLLGFYLIDLIIVLGFMVKNMFSNYSNLSEEQKLERLRRATNLRTFFVFFKLIPICVGTAYSFTSPATQGSTCDLMRFCLGLVCISTWLLILIPPSKPELPVRRSIVLESFLLGFVLTINCAYLGTVAPAIDQTNHTSCVYDSIEDLYSGSPLKSFAYVGLILFSCTTLMHICNMLINQICFRFNARSRKWYINYFAFQYLLNYFGAIAVVYYFSIGAAILFQPRSGQPCRNEAPNLYRILLIWQWIRILSPLIAIPLIIICCWLGVCLGIILSYCLPASVTVPLLNSIRVCLKRFSRKI